MSAPDLVSVALLGAGAVFSLLAALGVLRLPDVYTRMSATSKAATLGAVALLLGAAAHFEDGALLARAIATAAFLFLTAPVAAHQISRAAYRTGTPLWSGTRHDELAQAARQGGENDTRRILEDPGPRDGSGHGDAQGRE